MICQCCDSPDQGTIAGRNGTAIVTTRLIALFRIMARTAMVFVWSNLTRGEPHFTLSKVALNDAIKIVAFAPIVALLLGLFSIIVPWDTLLLSVVLNIVVPVIFAQATRRMALASGSQDNLQQLLNSIQPLSLLALLATLVLLFAFQGKQILVQSLVIGLLAIPILI